MPVLSEPTARERKRGRGWIWVLAAVPAVLVLFLVGTTMRPLELETGRALLVIGGWWGDNPVDKTGFHNRSYPIPGGIWQIRLVQLGPWGYAVAWFDGRRQP